MVVEQGTIMHSLIIQMMRERWDAAFFQNFSFFKEFYETEWFNTYPGGFNLCKFNLCIYLIIQIAQKTDKFACSVLQ